MIISLIAAMSSNRVIGRHGRIPWHIPEDLRRFRELTFGKTLIMGRRTFESIGRPLPGRKTVIVTRQAGYAPPGCVTATSLAAGLRLAAPAAEVFICGGGDIYLQALPFATRIYLTVVNEAVSGDTFFPEIPADEFDLIASERLAAAPDATLNIFVRRNNRPPQDADENH
jgi:dihydrofolate reductase